MVLPVNLFLDLPGVCRAGKEGEEGSQAERKVKIIMKGKLPVEEVEAEHGLYDMIGIAQIFDPEIHPAYHNDEEGEYGRNDPAGFVIYFQQEQALQYQEQAVESPPDDEVPAGAMPQAR